MRFDFILNDEKVWVDAQSDVSLLTILRHKGLEGASRARFLSAKRGCDKGICGSCTVQLNGKSVPSCLIPISLVAGSKVLTLEAFSKTKMYQSILDGFDKVDIHLCGFCNAGKIFAAKDIIDKKLDVTKEEVLDYIAQLPCCCTDHETLATGILCAIEIYKKNKEVIVR